jgi:acid stress-induced BolA-like protein IbaG/YrbA
MAKGTVTEPSYVERLIKALKRKLPRSHIHSEFVRADRYRFVVINKKFDDMDHPDRQHIVWDIADDALPKEDLRKVTMILTVAPSEISGD